MEQDALKRLVSPALDKMLAAIRRAGGRPVLVGGCVRDALMGLAPKDIDVEVYGLPAEPLKAALREVGRVFAVGISFGVLKVYLEDGSEIDVALPRRESRPGEFLGDLGTPDPQTTPQEAAARRDFTINAMSYDPSAAALLDFYRGQADLKAGILRHTSPAFAEDPLRVLRGMQFAARWNFRLAPVTAEFCAGLRDEYPKLAKERIWGEWHKLFLKGKKPSAGMAALSETGWRSLYPPLENLASRGEWLPTVEALDRAADLAELAALPGDERIVLLLATLAHRFAPGETETFLAALDCPHQPARLTLNLTREVTIYRENSLSATVVRRLAYRLAPVSLVQWRRFIAAIDPAAPVDDWLELGQKLGYATGQVKPLLQGRHLQEAGLAPGPRFGKLLEAAMQAQLEGEFDTLEGAKAWLEPRLNKPNL